MNGSRLRPEPPPSQWPIDRRSQGRAGAIDPLQFGQSLVAAVQTHGEASLTAQQVKEFLARKLAKFKVPRIVEFRDSLPREDTGKIFKRRLQEEYAMRQ